MLPAGVRIFLCTEPQDMRRSFDALALVTREVLGEDPQSGALFVFVGKRPTRAKVMWWDRNGFCILYKRLHRALFRLPEGATNVRPGMRIDGAALAQLLAGVDCAKKSNASLTRDRQ